MIVRTLLLFVFCGLLSAAEVSIEGIDPPPPCESKLYSWTGERYECVKIDRLLVLISQRDVNFKALTACQKQVDFLRARAELETVYQKSRDECRAMGKQFDEIGALCADPLSPEQKEN